MRANGLPSTRFTKFIWKKIEMAKWRGDDFWWLFVLLVGQRKQKLTSQQKRVFWLCICVLDIISSNLWIIYTKSAIFVKIWIANWRLKLSLFRFFIRFWDFFLLFSKKKKTFLRAFAILSPTLFALNRSLLLHMRAAGM